MTARSNTFNDPDAALTCRQAAGIFESMETRFEGWPVDDFERNSSGIRARWTAGAAGGLSPSATGA